MGGEQPKPCIRKGDYMETTISSFEALVTMMSWKGFLGSSNRKQNCLPSDLWEMWGIKLLTMW